MNTTNGLLLLPGYWDVHDLTELSNRLARSDLFKLYKTNLAFLSHMIPMRLFNRQGKKQARKDIASHYDLGPELFENFLDKNMNYTCAYWKNASDLDEAQQNKMNLIGRKLKLEKGESTRLLGRDLNDYIALLEITRAS